MVALHRFYRAELDRRAEWTQLHDGVTPFARMTLASPTLVGAFARAWGEVEAALAHAFAEIEGDADGDADGVTAGQVSATIRALSNANLVRQAAGLTTDRTANQSYREAAAFALLESGLAAFGS